MTITTRFKKQRRGKYRNYRPERKRDIVTSIFIRATSVVAAVISYKDSLFKIEYIAASQTILPDHKEEMIVSENKNMQKKLSHIKGLLKQCKD